MTTIQTNFGKATGRYATLAAAQAAIAAGQFDTLTYQSADGMAEYRTLAELKNALGGALAGVTIVYTDPKSGMATPLLSVPDKTNWILIAAVVVGALFLFKKSQ